MILNLQKDMAVKNDLNISIGKEKDKDNSMQITQIEIIFADKKICADLQDPCHLCAIVFIIYHKT